ncbi:MAG: UPF0104 family protein [Hyphomonadaceae bacterium]|nr:UPF0104 family protein [Hyphomonadaceae bacterium]
MDASQTEGAPQERRFKLPRWVSIVLAVAFFAGAIWIIRNELRQNSPEQILGAFQYIATSDVVAAIALVFVSYACLIGCERIALSIMGCSDLPLRRMWRPTFTAYALGNAIGFSYATVPAARARLYKDYLSGGQIAALSAITGATVMLAGSAVAGAGLLIAAEEIATRTVGTPLLWRLLGCVLVAPAIAWIITALNAQGGKMLFGMQVPKRRIAFAQVAMGMADWIAASAVLYILLPGHGDWSFPAFMTVFLAAGVLGSVSGTPAGIGVFEASILAFSPDTQHAPTMAAALIAYRLIWTMAPLVGAAVLLIYDVIRPALLRGARSP